MTNARLFFWSLTLYADKLPEGGFSGSGRSGVSAHVQPRTWYFATQEALEKWNKKNPDVAKDAVWAMHEIDLVTCRKLLKLSQKKPRCAECGK